MSRKKVLILVFIVVLIFGASYFFNGYVERVKLELDNKSEWSIVQAGVQQTMDVKPNRCEARFLRHGSYYAVGFWSGQRWLWFLINPRIDLETIKVLPEPADFFVSDSDLARVRQMGASKSLLQFVVKHRLRSCPA